MQLIQYIRLIWEGIEIVEKTKKKNENLTKILKYSINDQKIRLLIERSILGT